MAELTKLALVKMVLSVVEKAVLPVAMEATAWSYSSSERPFAPRRYE